MPTTLNKVTLTIKNDEGSYTTSNIVKTSSVSNLVRFASAYNSLQQKEADMFIKKSEYLVTAPTP